MKNYSFSNIANEQTYATRKSNDFSNLYRHSELKSSEANLRIEEIKKKYDTPSRRERIESLKKSKDCELLSRPAARQDPKESIYQHRPAPTFGSNHLKQSFAVNRLEKSTLKNDPDSKDFMNLRAGDRDYRRPTDKENDYAAYKSGNREEEEAIFSKVREMKESIINNDYMKSSINGRASISSAKFSQYDHKYEAKKELDPRVENIDKINSKIKQILSCLSENQKNPSKYLKEPTSSSVYNRQETTPNKQSAFFGNRIREISQSKKSYEGHFHKGSDVVQKYNVYEPRPSAPTNEQPKELPKSSFVDDKSRLESNASKPSLDYKYRNRDYSVNRVQAYSKDYSVSRPFKREEELVRTPSYLNKDYANLKGSRSRSQIDSFKRSTLGANQNSDVLKSGKKLNDEISKIQQKIEEFEKEKRKLNIEFTPFTLKNKSTANLNVSAKPERAREEPKQNQQSRNSTKNFEERSSSNDYKFKSYMNRASAYEQKYGDFANRSRDTLSKEITKSTSIYDNVKSRPSLEGDFQLKIQQIQVKTVRIQNDVENNEEKSINNRQTEIDSAAIKKRTDEGIEERRRRLQGGQSIITTESLKKIVSLFCQQVKLDESLRNMKIWLESCFDSDKFTKIMRNLQKEGTKLTLKECQTIFTVDQSEHNPFFSVQGFEGNINALTSAYIEADRHWKTQILNKFDKSSLLSQGFTSQKIDLERKGFIELQDLVRFLNIESGTFYRNRDLFLIFHRFTRTQRLNFDEMLGQICA